MTTTTATIKVPYMIGNEIDLYLSQSEYAESLYQRGDIAGWRNAMRGCHEERGLVTEMLMAMGFRRGEIDAMFEDGFRCIDLSEFN